MSLSFVTKAIQTTAADGTFEEQAVDNDDDKQGATRGGSSIGLFDQLRQNKDEEESARLEFQRSIMRGTLALDEDDAAHLQELQRQKEAENAAQTRFTESQLASFRAAQAERLERSTTIDENQNFSSIDSITTIPTVAETTKLSFFPNIKIKKRKRQDHQNERGGVTEAPKKINESVTVTNPEIEVVHDSKKSVDTSENISCTNKSINAEDMLSSLLVGYSSDEDS